MARARGEATEFMQNAKDACAVAHILSLFIMGRSHEIPRKLSNARFAKRRLFAQLDPGELVRAPERLL